MLLCLVYTCSQNNEHTNDYAPNSCTEFSSDEMQFTASTRALHPLSIPDCMELGPRKRKGNWARDRSDLSHGIACIKVHTIY
jgi:hypothetical protein